MVAAAMLDFDCFVFYWYNRYVVSQSRNSFTKFGEILSIIKLRNSIFFSKAKMAACAILESTLPVQQPSWELNFQSRSSNRKCSVFWSASILMLYSLLLVRGLFLFLLSADGIRFGQENSTFQSFSQIRAFYRKGPDIRRPTSNYAVVD